MEKIIRSEYEKDLYCTVFGEAEKLPFPTHIVKSDVFADEEVYEIPLDSIEEVFKSLWVFTDRPSISEQRLDVHEDAVFDLRDFQVIRYKNRNMIVSPYYFKSGGTILDFVSLNNGGVHVVFLKKN